MGLRSAFQGVAKSVVTAFGDVSETIDYYAFASNAVNTSTGAATTVYTTVAGITAIMAGFEAKDIDGQNVRKTDVKGLIPSIDLPSVTPSASDRVIRADGVAWNVLGVKTDPATALWQLHLRKP